ncbi:MAG: T9SS type A sorting domain-containing protein [Bacteroidota bacterium]
MKSITKVFHSITAIMLVSTLVSGQSVTLNDHQQVQLLHKKLSKDVKAGVEPVVTAVQSDYNHKQAATSDKSASILYENGPITTHPGAGSGGSDYSEVQDITLGLSAYGFAFRKGNEFINHSLADDFEVTENWLVSTITFYGYQTSVGPPSSFTDVRYRIYDGDPRDSISTIIFGDFITNKLITTHWMNVWRTLESAPEENRPIMEIIADASGLVLSPGTYWIEWQGWGYGNNASHNFVYAPPVSILGQATTGNAIQYTSVTSSWQNTTSGNDDSQGLAFMFEGASGSLATNDLTASDIISPVSAYGLGQEELSIMIYNYGTDNQSGFDVSYTINGGDPIIETVNETVPPNGSLVFTFAATADLSEFDNYSLEACTILAGDEDPANDCTSKNVTNIHGITVYPQMADYWTGSTNSNTKTETSLAHASGGNTEAGWMKFDISSVPDGATINNITLFGFIYDTRWPEWSITPLTKDPVTGSAAELWNEIQAGSGIGPAYLYNEESVSFSSGWHAWELGISAIADFTNAVSQDWFALGFYNMAGNQYFPVKMHGWDENNIPYIVVDYEDDVAIKENAPPVLTVFPNPAKDVVNIEAASIIKTIGIYNQTGQLIATEQLMDKQKQINVSQYDPGIYLLRIETVSGYISRRIIIQ